MKSNTNTTKSQNWLPISLIIFSILLTALPWTMPLIWPNIIVHLYYMVPGLVLLSAVSIQTINQNFKQSIKEANDLEAKIDKYSIDKNTEQQGNDNASSSSVIDYMSIDTSSKETSTNLTKDDRIELYIKDENPEYIAESIKLESFPDSVNNQLRLITGRPVQLTKFFDFKMTPDSWAKYFQKTLMDIRDASHVGMYYKVKDNNLTLNNIILLFIDVIDYLKHDDVLVPKTFLDQALNLYIDLANQIQCNISNNMKEIQNELIETSTQILNQSNRTQSHAYDVYVSALKAQKENLSKISTTIESVCKDINAYFDRQDLSFTSIKKLPEICLFTAIPEGRDTSYLKFVNARYKFSLTKLKHKYNNELLDQIISVLYIDDATGSADTKNLKTRLVEKKRMIETILSLKKEGLNGTYTSILESNLDIILFQKMIFQQIDDNKISVEQGEEDNGANNIIDELKQDKLYEDHTFGAEIKSRISDLVCDISEIKRDNSSEYDYAKSLCFNIIDLTFSLFSIDEKTMLEHTLDGNAFKYFEAIDTFLSTYKNNKIVLDDSLEDKGDKLENGPSLKKRNFLLLCSQFEKNLPQHTVDFIYGSSTSTSSRKYDYSFTQRILDMKQSMIQLYDNTSDDNFVKPGFDY